MSSKIRRIAHKPKVQDVAVYNDVAVQNVWNTVLDIDTAGILFMLTFRMETLAEDIEFEVTVDGKTATATQAAAVAGTTYYVYVRGLCGTGDWIATATTTVTLAAMAPLPFSESLLVRVRKTTAGGANTLRAGVAYSRY